MTKRPRQPKYHSRQLGGGNTLKAVTRTVRSMPGHLPIRAFGPSRAEALHEAHARFLVMRAVGAIEAAQDREAA